MPSFDSSASKAGGGSLPESVRLHFFCADSQILRVFQSSSVPPHGFSIEDIARMLNGAYRTEQIRSAIDNLTSEGHLVSHLMRTNLTARSTQPLTMTISRCLE
jgi:hypothetical protein